MSPETLPASLKDLIFFFSSELLRKGSGEFIYKEVPEVDNSSVGFLSENLMSKGIWFFRNQQSG